MGSQIKLVAVGTIMQAPVFLFSEQEDGSRKRIHYEPKSIAEVKLDFYTETLQGSQNFKIALNENMPARVKTKLF